MNPAMLARTPLVVAQTARARLAPRHRVARAAAVKTTTVYESRRGAVRFGAVQQGHRTTTCNASSESNSEKTVSALDAILAGSTDDTEPEPEVPEPVVPRERKPGEVSDAMKAKMLNEYVGVGGTPNKPMPSNLFLNIILGISALAVLCKLGGDLGDWGVLLGEMETSTGMLSSQKKKPFQRR
eukprot:CAMPEP_0117642188 /NCGR_PEP_ID=MMETSP0802-20121206/9736_1 /TAXON_ID=38833 /ORGANISM="Micromonas sp., Strain CCMP2099" /LENGTH=182 /DNA_ID=CAMNT_0005447189 /DNA_START=38 /DNA_END=583 /DNA_ORIENTATION=+